jgi:hypothetical protein
MNAILLGEGNNLSNLVEMGIADARLRVSFEEFCRRRHRGSHAGRKVM